MQLIYEQGGGAFGKVKANIAMARRALWWEKNGDFDPIPYWERLKVPGIIFYGDTDPLVPVTQSVARLESELSDAPDVTVHVIPGTGHGLFTQETKLSEAFLQYLDEWLQEKNVVGEV